MEMHYSLQVNHLILSHQTDGGKVEEAQLVTLCYPATSSTDAWNQHCEWRCYCVSEFCHQSAAVKEKQSLHLIYIGPEKELICFYSVYQAAGQKTHFNCPYVSCEARQEAAVSPQSVGQAASSALPRCCATQASLRPVSVGCWGERNHYIRRRCHWGSVKLNNGTHSESI